ncbi:DUF2637 domain-containing protein [Micromonospora chokoriensis]|uniref:DUF2637 domain-containing protein n=1 Tax=Micromonospora chokoriensis TaxID=356851 RepID=UPI0004C3CF13|nr:DUF2637 domain-containing protein [Micromonospora chokoriensis]
MIRERAESGVRVLILLVVGTMAGAAAFTHVHDLTVAHGQPDWIGWANAVAVELMAIYLGLEIRARRRTGRPVGLVGVLLIAFALLSLAAQVAEAEPSVWGWIVAAVPSLAFLALVKVVLSSEPAAAPVPEPDQPQSDWYDEPQPVEPAPPAPVMPPASVAVLPPVGVVQSNRPQVVGIIR